MKMAVDAPKEPTTKKNLSMLLDWHNMLILPYLISMLYYVNSLVKFAQCTTCYIVYFNFVVRFAKVIYIDYM